MLPRKIDLSSSSVPFNYGKSNTQKFLEKGKIPLYKSDNVSINFNTDVIPNTVYTAANYAAQFNTLDAAPYGALAGAKGATWSISAKFNVN